jgi:3-oxoacyl-[acyl-carrier protein] reductase
MADLKGRTALVTGGSRGIGRAIARRLAADGALVAVHYGRDEAAARETVTAIERSGGEAFPVRAEFGVADDVETLFGGLETELAGRGLDILVNNAGQGGMGEGLDTTTPESFDRLFAVNVRAPFFVTQRILPLLRDGGRIIFVSSFAPRIAVPQQVTYAMTKGAIDVLGRTLANAAGARNITVNMVAPGSIATDMTAFLAEHPEMAAGVAGVTALGRIGQPDEVADAVAFLASDDSRYVTGHVLDVTGGTWLGPIGP